MRLYKDVVYVLGLHDVLCCYRQLAPSASSHDID